MTLNTLDWGVILVYLMGMIGLSCFLARGQKTGRDYYLGGNKISPLPIAFSTMATQCSTNSLLGAPAFVAFAAGGGLNWLQFELAVPFAMIALIAVVFPLLRGLNLVSVYAYLENRFDVQTRTIVSLFFQFIRAFGTGVTVYGISLVLMICLNIPFWAAVLMLGGITIIYDVLGGMQAVIWSDVIQILVLLGAILTAIVVAVNLAGGLPVVFDQPVRLKAVNFHSHGLGDGQTFAFWPMLIGGFFLYVSYYGCDQTQAQRELSTRSVADTSQALFLDGMMRFPLVLSYCLLGLCLGAYALLHPDFVPALPLTVTGEPNYNVAVPVFVLRHFPHGLIGLVMVGLFAAAMSSLDSTLNALSALSMQDIVKRYVKSELSDRRELIISKLLTVFWGLVCVFFAFFVGEISETIVESINKIGSLLNGPLLAVFMMGMLTRRVNSQGATGGLLVGFAVNLLLWRYAPSISWLWWNVIGFFCAFVMGYLISLAFARPHPAKLKGTLFQQTADHGKSRQNPAVRYYLILALYGTGILVFLIFLTYR
jgi:SSS family solute:Na+ symporter